MKYTAFAIFLFCMLPIGSLLQEKAQDFRLLYNKANEYYELDDPTNETDSLAINFYLKTIAVLHNVSGYDAVRTDCYIKTGNIYQGQQQYIQSIPYYHQALQLAMQSNDTTYLYQAALYLGSARYSVSEVDSARFYFEYASGLAGSRSDFVDLPILYNSLGIIYFEAANYQQAINYFQLAADRLSPADESYEESVVSFKMNIAGCYSRLGKYAEALQRYRALLPYKQLQGSLFQNIGHTYYYLQQYDSSLYYFGKVPQQASAAYARMLNEKGRIYMQQGMLQKAEAVFDSSIALFQQLAGGGKNKDKATSLLYRSQLAQQQGLFNEAISWCNLALQELHFSFNGTYAESLPENETAVVSPISFFQVLNHKASLLDERYQQTKELHWLESSLQTRLLAIRSAHYIKNNFDNDEATFFFNEISGAVYKQAAQQAATLYRKSNKKEYLNHFLFITESYKGNTLHRNQVQTMVKASGLLPDSLLQEEADLKQLLAVFTTRLNNSNSNDQLNLVQKRITELQYRLSRLHNTYQQYPDYTALQNPAAALITGIDSLQEKLPASTVVLQYVWTDSVMLCLAVSKKNTSLFASTVDERTKQQLQDYSVALYEPKEGVRFKGYEASALLYQFLFSSLPPAIASAKQWVILPDGPLHELPFETLITNKNERRFLLADKTISYHYSFTLLLNKQHQQIAGSFYTAAPFTVSGTEVRGKQFPALLFSKQEISKLKGMKAEHSNATRQHFLQQAPNSSVIHLATHAVAGLQEKASDNSFVQFYHTANEPPDSSRLYLHELYSLRLQNNPLVILSACETAVGKQTESEGLLSLARGFMYAGSKGIVSSLWKADDRITAYLMQQLHYYLEKNYSVEEALQKAKIDLLNDDTIDARYKSPAYWGQFIYIGAIKEQEQRKQNNLLLIGSVAVALLFVILFYRKRLHFMKPVN